MNAKNNIVAIKVSRDDLIRAASNLNELADYVGSFFAEKNFDGQGSQDAADARQDILTGAKACMILLNCIDSSSGKGDVVQ